MRPRTQISMLAALVLTVTTAAAQTQRPMLYELQEGSTFQRGCWPPCRCPLGPKEEGSDVLLAKILPKNDGG